MKITGYLTVLCLALSFFVNGQNKSIQLADLYGEWTLYHNEDDLEEEYVFQRQKEANTELDGVEITISLLAFDECKVNYDTDSRIYCGFGRSSLYEYSWSYNENLQIIQIYKSNIALKTLKEENPEEFEKLGLPDNYSEQELEMELATLQLKNGSTGLEILNWE